MEGPVNQTPDFADRLASTQDQLLECGEDDLKTARGRFLAEANAPTKRANRAVWVAGPALVVLAAAAAAALYVVTSVETSLTATSQGADVAVGDWISSGADTVAIDFSDGTQIELDANSNARIVAMNADGARLLLERGHADLDVVHTGDADWSIAAGPFNVAVTGTHFGTEWSPEEQTLVIRMQEGSVLVFGPLLDDGQQVVSDVGTLTVSLRDGTTQLTMGPLPEVAAVVEVPVVEAAPEAPLRVERPALNPAPTAAVVEVEVRSWKDLYGEGKYKEALRLAEEVGVDSILQRSNGTDLYLFGDNARLAGDSSLARTSFESLRNRFPGTSNAVEASWLLGKVAYDGGDHRGAARWLRIHIDESPTGANSDQAMGLLMLSYDSAGDRPAARDAAKAYLARFPKGSYADTAKTLSKRR